MPSFYTGIYQSKCPLFNAIIIFFFLISGFAFCGWVILGPFHIKFRSLSTTSECLFALINGDDLFATFSMLGTDSPIIWYFSRAYVYVFIFLFIYVVLSLFIAIIMDSYETIKDYYSQGILESRVQVNCLKFIFTDSFNLHCLLSPLGIHR